MQNPVYKVLNLSWITGPIFSKELRVSSRRRRNYVLRFVYVALLTIFLAMVWLEEVRYRGSSVYSISRMAKAGQTIIAFIAWLQFCITQLAAVIMLSTSISDEIYNRTLGLLMTTPITSFQIVMGKLLSKLLQLILLLAISLPLLAVVRVFGGVPWGYVTSSLCMTLTTIILVGSASLFFSIFTRRPYKVIIIAFVFGGIFWGFLPLLSIMLWHTTKLQSVVSEKTLFFVISMFDPYFTMAFNTIKMLEPGSAGLIPSISWLLHCGVMLAVSALILFISIVRVRKVALRQVTGQLGLSRRKRRSVKNNNTTSIDYQESVATIRRITGPPVLWKELRFPILGRRKIVTCIFGCLSLILLLLIYYLCGRENMLDDEDTHISFVLIALGLGLLSTVVLSATCITSEKESRSWPLLLATTLDDRAILFGKWAGILRRCLPAWIWLLGHMVIFSLAGFIHPVAILQIVCMAMGTLIFLSGSGLYFSSCFKHTTTAVTMNFALAILLWAILPILMFMMGEFFCGSRDPAEVYMDTNPFIHVIAILEATVGRMEAYQWFSFRRGNSRNIVESTIWIVACASGYILLGLLFAWRAKSRFRRHIF
ncbi:MAG: ABC transporter permease subunit [Sedimentisphaerales bacterium]|nr:ABC transporter permease subunit [Sedimentisphaerales bacterium]